MMFLWLGGCNRYSLLQIYDSQTQGNDRADVLFVIDNSESMGDEAVALAESFGHFVQTLVARQGSPEGGLVDVVDQYTAWVSEPGAFVNFQLAITTIDAADSGGELLGDPAVLSSEDPELEDLFLQRLLCEAACFEEREQVPSEPGYSCEQGFTGAVSQEYLDCVCGESEWLGHCGSTREQGLEAVHDALCRAVPSPLTTCFDDGRPSAQDAGSNATLLRPGATFVPVIVTDEGDSSHRMADVDVFTGIYGQLFAGLGAVGPWAVIAPSLQEDYVPRCDPLVTSWGTLRYEYLVQATGGLKLDLEGTDCEPADWNVLLEQLGTLVAGGTRAFRLPTEPVPESLVVRLDREVLPRSIDLGVDLFGQTVWSEGFSYDEETWTVYLHGGEVTAPLEQRVRIWYEPR
jgi:hypothetical protein